MPPQFAELLRGVVAMLIAPFDRFGDLDTAKLETIVRRCDEAGVHVITALANTAEVHQLDISERKAFLRTVASTKRRAGLLAGLAGGTHEIIQLGRIATGLGYEALMLHEPMDPFSSPAGVVNFWLKLAEQLPLPVVVYPRGRFEVDHLVELATHPNVIGIKYANTDVKRLAQVFANSNATRSCTWVCGSAESAYSAHRSVGIRGFSSGLANIRPDLALRVWRAAGTRGDEGLKAALQPILPFEKMRVRENGRHSIAILKMAMRLQGVDVGEVRPPCEPLDPTGMEELRNIIVRWPKSATQSSSAVL